MMSITPYLSYKSYKSDIATTIQVGRNAPLPGWVAFNVDGSVNSSNENAGYGGIFRDCEGLC